MCITKQQTVDLQFANYQINSVILEPSGVSILSTTIGNVNTNLLLYIDFRKEIKI